ncbi:MAG: TIGR01906 family membrane protein [Dehalococcoidia bacterium]
MKLFAHIATALFIVSVPLFLVTTNVRFATGDSWFTKQGFRTYNVDQTTGVSYPELDAAADDIVRYFEDDRSSLRIQVTIDGRETALFNEDEISHMRDVKNLVRVIYRLNEASLAVIIAYVGGVVLWTRERSPRQLAKYSVFGVAVGLVLVVAIGAFAATGFDAAWTRFHEIAFPGGNWRFNSSRDRLIQMFPEPFWEDMTFIVGGLTVLEVLAVVSVSVSYLVFGRPSDAEATAAYEESRQRKAS